LGGPRRAWAVPVPVACPAVELEGKRILVSGATGGIGQAIAERLAAGGAKLVLSSRRGKELKEIARGLPGGSRRHKVIVSDLAKAGAAQKLIRDAADLDGFVANAGINAPGLLEEFSAAQLSTILRVNLEVPMQMARVLAPALAEKGEGHMVFISSLAGKGPSPRTALYSATKFGIRGFALSLREDLVPQGVGVSVVYPGFVREAGMFADSGAKAPSAMGTTTPAKVGKAVAKAIRSNRSEIDVAPFRARRLTKFAARHPELAGRATRGGKADRVAAEIAAGTRKP
jgi:short-subunit dehydrogenase